MQIGNFHLMPETFSVWFTLGETHFAVLFYSHVEARAEFERVKALGATRVSMRRRYGPAEYREIISA